MSDTCPGCIGRGTGTHCCMCSEPIPDHLQRKNGPINDLDQPLADCDGCRVGRPHTHW